MPSAQSSAEPSAAWSSFHRPIGGLRILHWNIHSWRDDTGHPNIEAVAGLVRSTNPHVVSLVEVDELSSGDSTLDELAARTGYVSIFVPTFEFGDDQHPAGGFGNALLTRLPVHTVRQHQLLWPPRLYDGTEPSEPRSVLLAKVGTPPDTIWIGSTHLPRVDSTARTAALRRLVTIAQGLRESWLLVGDFNTPATGWPAQPSSWRTYPTSREPTYPARDPVEAIDYCVAPDELAVRVDVLDTPGSDHLPILVETLTSAS
jgi:endonuclease/exonuclease/phosphatase family metal-dependent hydrolase